MSNRGGKEHQHGLVGMVFPTSSQHKRRNKAKARARKVNAVKKMQGYLKGARHSI